MPYMFRSEFPFILKQTHIYVDDHHGPHHEAVMVRELCIAIDENRFTVFTAEEMCHLIEYFCYMSIPLFSILIWFINVYKRIENFLYFLHLIYF